MSSPKYKVTGFARFMLFMLLFAPITYFGVTMAKGKSVEEIKGDLKGFFANLRGGANKDNDCADIIAAKDEEIQKLREEL